jgi:acetylornithine/succinyldiaminopimelate/putrescine aminotransferase
MGLMTLVAGPNVHRFAPPLIIAESEINDALQRLDQAYAAFNKQP